MKTAIITSTKVKPRWRRMCEIYDLAAKSQCGSQTWSVGVLERRKRGRRVAPQSVALPGERCAGKRLGARLVEPISLHLFITPLLYCLVGQRAAKKWQPSDSVSKLIC